MSDTAPPPSSRLALLAALLLSGTASASAFQLEARTEAQVYQIRAWRDSSPDEPVLLPRRRIVQYLGLNGYELVTGQDMGFESSLRVFADFGLPRGEAARLDGLRSEDADLLYAFVRYGWNGIEGRLGRQVYGDVSDILAFDGLRVRYVSPLGIGAEVYGGLWVKGAGFLSSSVYQPDGTRESDARRLEQGVAGADPDALRARARVRRQVAAREPPRRVRLARLPPRPRGGQDGPRARPGGRALQPRARAERARRGGRGPGGAQARPGPCPGALGWRAGGGERRGAAALARLLRRLHLELLRLRAPRRGPAARGRLPQGSAALLRPRGGQPLPHRHQQRPAAGRGGPEHRAVSPPTPWAARWARRCVWGSSARRWM